MKGDEQRKKDVNIAWGTEKNLHYL